MATVYLSSVPWDASGNDFPLLSHDTLLYTMQQAGQVLETFTGISFVKDGSFELPISYTKYQNTCNYCVFNNGSTSATYVFAFVTRMEWTSANSTRFYYEVDPFATYGTSLRIAGARTRRRFTNDENGMRLYAGDFVGIGRKYARTYNLRYSQPNNWLLVYAQTNIFGPTTPPSSQSYAVSNVNGGLTVFAVRSSADYDAFDAFIRGGGADRLVAVFAMPSGLWVDNDTYVAVNNYNYPSFNYNGESILVGTFNFLDSDGQRLISPITRNDNDLLLRIQTGASANYVKPSDLSSLTYSVRLALSPVPSLAIIPDWLNNTSAVFTFTDFVQIALTGDALMSWLNRNAVSLLSTGSTLLTSAAIGPAALALSAATQANSIFHSIRTSTPATTPQSTSAIATTGQSIVSCGYEWWNITTVDRGQPLQFYTVNGYPDYSISGSPSAISVSFSDYDYFKYSDPIIAGAPAGAAAFIRSKLESGVRLWLNTTMTLL